MGLGLVSGTGTKQPMDIVALAARDSRSVQPEDVGTVADFLHGRPARHMVELLQQEGFKRI